MNNIIAQEVFPFGTLSLARRRSGLTVKSLYDIPDFTITLPNDLDMRNVEICFYVDSNSALPEDWDAHTVRRELVRAMLQMLTGPEAFQSYGTLATTMEPAPFNQSAERPTHEAITEGAVKALNILFPAFRMMLMSGGMMFQNSQAMLGAQPLNRLPGRERYAANGVQMLPNGDAIITLLLPRGCVAYVYTQNGDIAQTDTNYTGECTINGTLMSWEIVNETGFLKSFEGMNENEIYRAFADQMHATYPWMVPVFGTFLKSLTQQ